MHAQDNYCLHSHFNVLVQKFVGCVCFLICFVCFYLCASFVSVVIFLLCFCFCFCLSFFFKYKNIFFCLKCFALVLCAHTHGLSKSHVQLGPLRANLPLHKVLYELMILHDQGECCIAFHVGYFLFADHAHFRVCLNIDYCGKGSRSQCR